MERSGRTEGDAQGANSDDVDKGTNDGDGAEDDEGAPDICCSEKLKRTDSKKKKKQFILSHSIQV
jgi:hypothetical protein